MERLFFEFVIRTTLIAAATALILWTLRIRAAGARHAAWSGVTLAMLLLPGWMAWGPKASLRVLPARPTAVVSVTHDAAFSAEEGPVSLPAPIEPSPVRRFRLLSEADVWLAVYGLGAGLLLLRLAIGTARVRHLSSADCSAPVTVGFFRPRIILPESAGEWPQAQMDAVMTHEGAHARRRDPLFQWLALFNRAVFWFHPLAWWLERKLSALAEEACDAAVIERGHDPQDYSRTLLELARAVQQAGTRVNVVAMAMPGSYLPHRVKHIIAGIRTPKVSRARMACAAVACAIPAALFAAGTLEHAPQLLPLWPLPARAVPPPVLIAQATQGVERAPETPQRLEFEVATIKPITRNANGGYAVPGVQGGPGTQDPTRITYLNYDLKSFLLMAYGLKGSQLSGPDWLDRPEEMFVIQATVPPGATKEQVNQMLRTLLVDRFKIVVRHETKEENVYELTAIKRGPKLKESRKAGADDDDPLTRVAGGVGQFYGIEQEKDGFLRLPSNLPAFYPGGPQALDLGAGGPVHRVVGGRETVAVGLAGYLSFQLGRPVVDKTGLQGSWDFNLDYSDGAGPANVDTPSDPAPDLARAVRDQLGLKLEAQKTSVDNLVIAHIEKSPTDN